MHHVNQCSAVLYRTKRNFFETIFAIMTFALHKFINDFVLKHSSSTTDLVVKASKAINNFTNSWCMTPNDRNFDIEHLLKANSQRSELREIHEHVAWASVIKWNEIVRQFTRFAHLFSLLWAWYNVCHLENMMTETMIVLKGRLFFHHTTTMKFQGLI